MIAGEGRGTTLEGKIKDYVSGVSSHITPHKRYRRVISNDRPKKFMTLIRQYNEKDREQIIELRKTCNLTRPWNDPNKDFDRKNGVGEDLFIVLEFENKIIGTVMGGYDGHRGIMNYLAVSPDFRGKGFGKILVEEVEKNSSN